MPTLTLPRLIRALTARRRPATGPAPAPARVPAPRRPTPCAPPAPAPAGRDLALAFPTDPDPAPSGGPQAQGDVIVLPWLDFMSPHLRDLHILATVPVGRRGVLVHPTHVLLPEGAAVFWSWWPGGGPTLGTLVVPDTSIARLAHGEHADLRIGPGVYAVRRQRRAELHTTALVED